MTLVAQAVSRAFHAEKMNYELLGMGDAHLHWHLFPRRAGDIGPYGNGGKGPVWWYPMEKMYADESRPAAGELAEMKQKLQTELDRVLGSPKGTPAFWGEDPGGAGRQAVARPRDGGAGGRVCRSCEQRERRVFSRLGG